LSEGIEHTIQGGAGNLFIREWRPSSTPRALVAICHGFNSHSGMYAWCGDQFAQNGMVAYALDLRGRGKSAGERSYVDSFDDYVDDLSRLIEFAKSREPGRPVIVLGHSAGGVTACLYALQYQSKIAGLICEDFAFEVPAPDFALAVLRGISHLVPHSSALSLKNADFSRDPMVVKTMDADPLIAHEAQPFATMAAIVRADEQLKRSFPQITLPLFILHGTADKAAKPSGSRHFYERAGSEDKTLKFYEGRYHDMLNDFGKEEVMADIQAWIDKRLSKT
jgi:alpha-beta hydrolase superfamily lysophospholipase